MSLSTVRLSPTMDINQLVAALNENFALLEHQSISQIFKDETGTNRIILGRLPDDTYGLVVSAEGVDVLDVFE